MKPLLSKQRLFVLFLMITLGVAGLTMTPNTDVRAGNKICKGRIKDIQGPVKICLRNGDNCKRKCGFLEFK